MNPIISIIIPVYNTEKYLKKCLDSILNQGINPIEIILINDGSKDNSPQICNEYARRDRRITVIHKKNEGVSIARNTALDICTGEYIMFVDSDDYMKENALEILVSKLNTYKPDILMFGMEKVDDKERVIERIKFKERVYQEVEKYDFIEKNVYNSNWGYIANKIYHKKIIKEYKNRFNTQISSREDMEFNLSAIKFIDKLVCVEIIAYNYLRMQNFGALNTRNLNNIQSLEALSVALDKFNMPDEAMQRRITQFIIKNFTVDLLIQDIINNNLSHAHKKEYINRIFNNKSINKYCQYDRKDNRISKLLSICVKYKMPRLFHIVCEVVLNQKRRVY